MATPQLQLQNPTLSISPGSPASVKVLSKNADGTALDVSSGYTVQALQAYPSADQNQLGNLVDVTAQCTFAFSTTGITINMTGAQTNALAALLACLHSGFMMEVSNDSGTTKSLMAVGTLAINNPGFAL